MKWIWIVLALAVIGCSKDDAARPAEETACYRFSYVDKITHLNQNDQYVEFFYDSTKCDYAASQAQEYSDKWNYTYSYVLSGNDTVVRQWSCTYVKQ